MFRQALALTGALLLAGCASTAGDPAAAPSPSPTPVVTTPAPEPVPRYVFPVAGKSRFGRAHHDYPAADIFAPCGSAFVAPTAGTVTEVARSDTWSSKDNAGAERGGLSVTVLGADGVRYYGSHLRTLAPAAAPGRTVAAGTRLGEVGSTGSARGIACHLHFGLSPTCSAGDWWVRRGVVAPYDFLKAWQRGEQLSPAAAVTAWKQQNGCPAEPRDA